MIREDIRISLPSKGRLAQDAEAFLAACGLTIDKPNPRQYAASFRELPGVTVLFQRPTDIVVSVREGSVDFGITGLDVTAEYGGDADAILVLHEALGFGGCRLSVAVPEAWRDVHTVGDLALYARGMPHPLRVATKFKHLTRAFFEGAPRRDLLHAGRGRGHAGDRAGHRLRRLHRRSRLLRADAARQSHAPAEDGVILRSQAALIANRARLAARPDVLDAARLLLEYTEAHLRAQEHVLVTANMRGESPEAIAERMFAQAVLGGLQGPTIAQVMAPGGAADGWYAVQIVVRRADLSAAIAELRAIGGSGVVVTPVTYIFEEEPERLSAMLAAVQSADEAEESRYSQQHLKKERQPMQYMPGHKPKSALHLRAFHKWMRMRLEIYHSQFIILNSQFTHEDKGARRRKCLKFTRQSKKRRRFYSAARC